MITTSQPFFIQIILFSFSTIHNYQQNLQNSVTSCTEAVQYYLDRINRLQRLNAFTEVYADESMERAKQLDAKRKQGMACGKLHGAIIAIKDVICYKNHKVTAASAMLRNFTSVYSATVVEKLLSEDAIIIGSCNCDEFAMGSTNENSIYGRVLNALDENKVSGGSSGGSAVAVQAALCMASIGSDTGGSVRQPADFCGVIGMKPTYGCISRHGLIAYASSFDQIGIFSNNIADTATILDVISGADEFDSTVKQNRQYNFPVNNEKKYRIALFKNALTHEGLDDEIKTGIYATAEKLRRDGHDVEEIDFALIDYIIPAYYVLSTAEASSNLARYDGVRYGHKSTEHFDSLTDFYKKNRSEGFGREVKKRIMLGTFVLSEGYYEAYFTKAQQIRNMLVQQTKDIFKKFDALIMPTAPSTAFEAGVMKKDPIAMYLADIYTVYANLVGAPAISLPLFKHSNGLPFGLQVITKNFDEATLFQLSYMLLNGYKQY